MKCIERSTLESSYTPSKTLRKPYISCCQPEWATVAAGEAVGACAEILRLTENPYKTNGKPPFSIGQEKLSTPQMYRIHWENKLFCPGQIKLIAPHRLSKLIAFHVICPATSRRSPPFTKLCDPRIPLRFLRSQHPPATLSYADKTRR